MEGTEHAEKPRNGACTGKPVDWFFPEAPRTRQSMINNREALRICSECNIVDDCLQYALEFEIHGIWGGTMPKEREEMRRSRGVRLRQRQYDPHTGEVTIK